jgi:hypothetical protein
MKGFMKTLNGFLLAGLFVTGAVNSIYAQGGDSSGRFSTPAYSGTDYAQAGSGGAGAGTSGSGAAAPATGGARTAITPGSSSTAIPQQPQQGNGTVLTPGAPAITPGAPAINQTPNTAIMPQTNNPAGGAVTNGIITQGTGTIGQQGNTAIGQQGNTAIGQQGTVGPGQQGIVNPGSPGRPAPNAFIVNPDGSDGGWGRFGDSAWGNEHRCGGWWSRRDKHTRSAIAYGANKCCPAPVGIRDGSSSQWRCEVLTGRALLRRCAAVLGGSNSQTFERVRKRWRLAFQDRCARDGHSPPGKLIRQA